MKLIIATLATLVAFTACKKDDDTGAADDGHADEGHSDADAGSTDTCMQAGETCALFAAHYVTCEGADAEYAASLTSGDFDDAGCSETYAGFVDGGCCDGL